MYRLAALLVFVPLTSIANDPLECVDPDFVRAFITWPNSTPVSYSTQAPEDFAVSALPSEWKLIGSRSEENSTTVIYSADQEVHDTYSGLAKALSQQGWEDITYTDSPFRRGFQSSRNYVSANYCRETDDNRLSVEVKSLSGETHVSLHQYERRTLHGCMATLRNSRLELMGSLPILNAPEGATTSQLQQLTIGHEIISSVDVSANVSRQKLLEFFGDQVRDQDWIFETEWSGKRTSGSVWSRDTAEHGILVGTLHLYDSGNSPVRVRFSIDTADPGRDIDHGLSGTSGCD